MKTNVFVMISIRTAGQQPVDCPYVAKTFNIAIFSDIIDRINVNLCMIEILTELYPNVPLSVTLIGFLGHRGVKQF